MSLVSVRVKSAYDSDTLGDLAVHGQGSVNEMLHHVQMLYCFLVHA